MWQFCFTQASRIEDVILEQRNVGDNECPYSQPRPRPSSPMQCAQEERTIVPFGHQHYRGLQGQAFRLMHLQPCTLPFLSHIE